MPRIQADYRGIPSLTTNVGKFDGLLERRYRYLKSRFVEGENEAGLPQQETT